MAEPLLRDSPLGREAAGLDACVHCGFCLTACPTYLTLEDENDSPRGRLVLMRAMLEGALDPADADAGVHLDRCLGCRACETACPSGVPYGHLLEAARATTIEKRPLPFMARALLFVFARPVLLTFAMACARVARATRLPALAARLPGQFGFPFAMLASTARPRSAPLRGAARDASLGSVALLTGCVMEGLFAPINRATEHVLEVQGYRMVEAPGQRCCGALHAHAGNDTGARELARHNIAAFETSRADYVVVNAAGCGSALKDYGHLLRDDARWRDRAAAMAARVRDVSELLAAAGPRPAPGGQSATRVAYDAPCHLQHAQRITEPPLAVLRAVTHAELVPLAGNDQCCGSAGIYNLIEPAVAAAVLQPKLAAIAASGAAVVATGNPGCLMQIGAGLMRSGMTAVARHPVELLADAYEGTP